MEYLILSVIIAYLVGSVPTAVWVGRTFYNVDVREHGSMNAGATNTFRVLGKKPGIIVLSADIFKGWAAVFFLALFSPYPEGSDTFINLKLVLGIAAILGHVFPVFAKFNGGKGVATSLGVIIALHTFTAGICIGIFLIVFLLSRYVSLGAIIAAVAFPCILIFGFKISNISFIIFSVLMSVVVLLTHRKNIERLINREENKMNFNNK